MTDVELASNDQDALLGNQKSKKGKSIKTLGCIVFVVLLFVIAAIIITIYFVFSNDESSHKADTDFFTIKQPTSIYINDESNFVLHVDYCNFEVFNMNITIINISTRCYCWKYSESTNIDVIPSTHDTDFNLNDYHCDIPGPTLHIKNDMTFNITLVNNMIGAEMDPERHETRMWPDVTNLHTHGLHIDPLWDNVFLVVNPGETVIYHYKVPQDHYPGTHWYHPHLHGSTNYQLHGGMFGGLIVDNNDKNVEEEFEEMIPIILSFHYYYFYTDPFCDCTDKTEANLFAEYTFLSNAGGPFQITSLCYDWCMMPIDNRNKSIFEYHANSDIANSDNGFVNIMLLNGQYKPKINLKSNIWYKFQMINGNGIFYTQINFENILNNTDLCNIHLMGNDGIFFNKSRNIRDFPYNNQIIIGPGSRADVAIQCQFISNISNEAIDIYSSGNTLGNAGIPQYPDEDIIFSIQIHENNEEKESFDLNELPKYDIPEFPDYLTVSLDANISTNCPCYTYDTPIEQCEWSFLGITINGQPFNLSKPLLQVCADKIYEFEISGVHPVHIHNTAFQIQRDLPLNNGFMAMKGDWRDTIGTNDDNFNIRYPTGHFVGPIIMHCHFLAHEDDGMLGYFEIIDCNQSPQCDA